MSSLRVAITGGGTGGHIYPALTIAKTLQSLAPGTEVLYIGTREGLEADIVPRSGLPFETVHVAGVAGKSLSKAVSGLVQAARGTAESLRLLRRWRPDVVVGTGGYVSGPVVLAGRLVGAKVAIQEQNAIPGFTSRVLSRLADRVFLPNQEARRYFGGGRKFLVTGNPVRPEVVAADREEARARLGVPAGKRLLFAFGGSRGARAINQALVPILGRLLERPDLMVLYVTGQAAFEQVSGQLREQGIDLEISGKIMVKPYFYEAEAALAAADLALVRAGAMTMAEIAVRGLPAVVIPFPFAIYDHQEKNARVPEGRGAAIVLRESQLGPERLAAVLTDLLDHPDRLAAMAGQMRELGRPEASERIAREVLALAAGHSNA
ncbi:MAG: undecaprenyldiphospho-muramoylpentapeptide beta-N-acetylglucosaminyltransferase [Symbiobacteriia bacterium]